MLAQSFSEFLLISSSLAKEEEGLDRSLSSEDALISADNGETAQKRLKVKISRKGTDTRDLTKRRKNIRYHSESSCSKYILVESEFQLINTPSHLNIKCYK